MIFFTSISRFLFCFGSFEINMHGITFMWPQWQQQQKCLHQNFIHIQLCYSRKKSNCENDQNESNKNVCQIHKRLVSFIIHNFKQLIMYIRPLFLLSRFVTITAIRLDNVFFFFFAPYNSIASFNFIIRYMSSCRLLWFWLQLKCIFVVGLVKYVRAQYLSLDNLAFRIFSTSSLFLSFFFLLSSTGTTYRRD